MTASQKPKTPSMTMNVREGIPQAEIDLFCKRASRVALSQLVDNVVVRETSKVEGQARRTVFSIDINFFPEEEYISEHDVRSLDILNVFSARFPLTFKKEIANEMKRLDSDLKSQIAELGKGKKADAREGGDDDAEEEGEKGARKKRGDDEESEVGDGDADDEKRARQKKQQATYESEDEGEDEEGEGEYDDAEIEAAYAEDENENVEGGERKKKKKKPSSLEEEASRVADSFTSHLHHATSFNFTPSQCAFEVEVCRFVSMERCHTHGFFLSSAPICQSCYLWALWSGHAAQPSFARSLESQIVSRSRMIVKKGRSQRSRSATITSSNFSVSYLHQLSTKHSSPQMDPICAECGSSQQGQGRAF